MRCLIVLILFVSPSGIFAAELTEDEKKTRAAIENVIRNAGRSYAAGKFDQAGSAVRRAMIELNVAIDTGSPELFVALQPVTIRVLRAHTFLELEGVSMPPFRIPQRPEAKGKAETELSTAEVSFTKTVAPILAQRCGGCHVKDSKGDFSMATYRALMTGPPEGVVIFAGDTAGSRLIEAIETGDMPRGGGKVQPAELITLKKWIASGAKFDGSQLDAPISGSPAVSPPAGNRQMIRQPSGKESVSFSKDIAPLLVDNCKGCHLEAMTTRGGLRMDTFAQLLRGGTSGAIIQPADGEASLLIKKLRGTEGQRMPAGGRPPLSDQSIQLIAKWIDEGAMLDGASQSQPLTVMSQLAWVTSATTEQISARRKTIIERNLKLAIPAATQFASVATENFLVTGDVSQGMIDLVAQQAEAQMKIVATTVPKNGQPVFRGRATIVVLPKRYAYSEFAKMIEQRSLPSDWTSHWRFDGIDAYVALVASERDDERVIADRLAAPLISLAVATQGSGVPFWFAAGVGDSLANGKDSRGDRNARRKDEAELRSAVSAIKNAKQFLDGRLTPEQTVRIGTAIVASMLAGKRRRGYEKMMREMAAGMPFEQAFAAGYGLAVHDYVNRWLPDPAD